MSIPWLEIHLATDYNTIMEKLLTTIPAHFDGKEIRLDVPILLKPNARLLITILEPELDDQQQLVEAAMVASKTALARIWDNDEDAIYDDL